MLITQNLHPLGSFHRGLSDECAWSLSAYLLKGQSFFFSHVLCRNLKHSSVELNIPMCNIKCNIEFDSIFFFNIDPNIVQETKARKFSYIPFNFFITF